MHFKFFLLFGVVFLRERIHAAPCNCGLGSGVDVCNAASGGGIGSGGIGSGGVDSGGIGSGGVGSGGVGSGGDGLSCPLVIRPQELPVIDIGTITKPRIVCKKVDGLGINPLQPIAGLCSCGRTIIKPAVIPRPSCGGCASGSPGSGSSGTSGLGFSQTSSSTEQIIKTGGGSISIKFPVCGPPVINKPRDVPQAPADAVSQDLAYRQQQQNRNDKAELKLAYGFHRIPIETPCYKKTATFKEGNIQSFNGQVLELANYAPKEEEVVEEGYEEEEEEEQPEDFEVLTPSFEDLGYRLANYKSNKFINVVNEGSSDNTDVGILPVCNDGFRPGEVIIREGQVDSGIPPQVPNSPICDEEASNPGIYPPYSSYSETSSSSHNAQSNIFIEKLSC